ncbi:hypothetical protein [Vulcanisaeta sp. JCM 16159]|uniref:hypothetical protein n=1 Tax=Vulcanisaeta sp. JCM 16159 TaxID=1295371 RepID=UPI0006D05461
MIKVREYMIRSLRDLDLRPLYSVTNFVTFHAGSPSRTNKVYDGLFRRGFVIRNLGGKVLCEDCLRVTVPPAPIAAEFIRALEETLDELRE